MEQVYNTVGYIVVWGFAVVAVSILTTIVCFYVRGFYRACRFANWCRQNKVYKVQPTGWVLVRTVFVYWNDMAWFGKNDTRSALNGAVFHV